MPGELPPSNTIASAPNPTAEFVDPDDPVDYSLEISTKPEPAPAQDIEAPAPVPPTSQSLQPASVVAETREHGNFGCIVFRLSTIFHVF